MGGYLKDLKKLPIFNKIFHLKIYLAKESLPYSCNTCNFLVGNSFILKCTAKRIGGKTVMDWDRFGCPYHSSIEKAIGTVSEVKEDMLCKDIKRYTMFEKGDYAERVVIATNQTNEYGEIILSGVITGNNQFIDYERYKKAFNAIFTVKYGRFGVMAYYMYAGGNLMETGDCPIICPSDIWVVLDEMSKLFKTMKNANWRVRLKHE